MALVRLLAREADNDASYLPRAGSSALSAVAESAQPSRMHSAASFAFDAVLGAEPLLAELPFSESDSPSSAAAGAGPLPAAVLGPLLKLLHACCQLRANRRALLDKNALPIVLGAAIRAAAAAEPALGAAGGTPASPGPSGGTGTGGAMEGAGASPGPASAQASPAERLLQILEMLVSEWCDPLNSQ